MSSEVENMGTANPAGAGSQAVPMDVDTSIVVASEVQAAEVGQTSGGAAEEVAAQTGQEDDGKLKEGEKKNARKQMATRSEWWNHFEKILVDGVLQKGKCNYCKTDIAAHSVNNGTTALGKHFKVCKRNPHKNVGDNKQAVLQVNHDSVLQSLLDIW